MVIFSLSLEIAAWKWGTVSPESEMVTQRVTKQETKNVTYCVTN